MTPPDSNTRQPISDFPCIPIESLGVGEVYTWLDDFGCLRLETTALVTAKSFLGRRPAVNVERFDRDIRSSLNFKGILLGVVERGDYSFRPIVPTDGSQLQPLGFEVVAEDLVPQRRIERPHFRHPY